MVCPRFPRQAVPLRRTDHGPALRRRRQAAARVPPAHRRRAFARGDRAQPGRDARLGLDHRPRPRGRRCGRRNRVRRHAGGGREASGSHTGRALREYEAALAQPAVQTGGRPENGVDWAAPTLCRRRSSVSLSTPYPHPQRARAQSANPRPRNPARQVHRRDRRLGLGQIHARLRHPVRRRPAALPRIAQRLRAPVRAAGDPAGRRRDFRHPADRRDRAAHQPRRQQEHGRDAHRDLPLPAAALREARHCSTAPTATCRSSRRARTRSRPASCATIAGQRIGLLAPLVVNRKGYYTDLAKWARGKGYDAPARGRRVPAHRRAGRAWTASASTRSSCRSPTCASAPDNEAALRDALARALEVGQRRGARALAARPARRCARSGSAHRTARIEVDLDHAAFLHQARLPLLRPQLPGARPAAVLLQLQARLVHRVLRHRACSSPGFDEEQTGRGDRGRTTGSRAEGDEPCPACDGRRLNREALAVRYQGRSISDLTALPVGQARGAVPRPRARRPRGRDRARHRRRAEVAPRVPERSRPLLPVARPLGARRSPAARRSASASPRSSARTCAACATSSTSPPSACIRATTASCSTRWRSSRPRATRWWWSSTTRTPSGAPRTSSISAPARAGRAGA